MNNRIGDSQSEIRNQKLTTMKKQLSKQSTNSPFWGVRGLLALLLFPLWGLGGWGFCLSAQSVTITPIGANYSNKTVTFRVSWSGSFSPDNRVWVWIDYCPVAGVTPAGTFGPTRIDGVTPIDKVSNITLRGFFVTANPTTVTATLNTTQAKFNWCAYGSGAPPRAELQPDGSYLLKGTPPFVVNDVPLDASLTSYSDGCIETMTDLTGHPAAYLTPKPEVFTPQPAPRCGAGMIDLSATAGGGATTAMTYTWTVNGGAPQTTTTGALPLEDVQVGSHTYSVSVNNAAGCTSAVAIGTITVHPAVAQASITGSATIPCIEATVLLTASASGATTFTWFENDSQVQTGTSTSYIAIRSGNYTVTGENANCTGTTSAVSTVKVSYDKVHDYTPFRMWQNISPYDGVGTWLEAFEFCDTRDASITNPWNLECLDEHIAELGPVGGMIMGGEYWGLWASDPGEHGQRTAPVHRLGYHTTEYRPADENHYWRCVVRF
jgi:hypothetical protein